MKTTIPNPEEVCDSSTIINEGRHQEQLTSIILIENRKYMCGSRWRGRFAVANKEIVKASWIQLPYLWPCELEQIRICSTAAPPPTPPHPLCRARHYICGRSPLECARRPLPPENLGTTHTLSLALPAAYATAVDTSVGGGRLTAQGSHRRRRYWGRRTRPLVRIAARRGESYEDEERD
jgi:hypothetical protein